MKKSNPVEWGFDTETQDGKAILLSAAGPKGECILLKFPRSFEECFRFLSRLSRKFTAFNMDYDARALLKFLPKRVWMELYRDESAVWNGFRISYQASRELTIRLGPDSVAIYDCFQHYQKSLKRASMEVFGENLKSDIPASWLPRMAAVCESPKHFAKVAVYAGRDAMACQRLWRELDHQFRNLGVDGKRLDRPISPGSIAAGYFRKAIHFPDLPGWANRIARGAYAGGRIEVLKRGRFRNVTILDIKSAYPYSLSMLPDPRAARIEEGPVAPPDALYSVYGAVFSIPPGHPMPPFPAWHPDSNVRIFPAGRFYATVTGPEWELAKSRGWLSHTVKGIHLCGPRRDWLGPEIRKLFALRKSRPEISHAVKLVLNSIYGKLAQVERRKRETRTVHPGETRRIGGKFIRTQESYGKTTNFFVAAYVTALTRLQLWRTCEKIGFGRIILAATDGLAFLGSPGRGIAKRHPKLGDWAENCRSARMVVVGTGVYAVRPPGSPWQNRVRGWRGLDDLTYALKSRRTRVPIRQQISYTLADAVTKNAVDMNAICTVTRELNVNFDGKRAWPRPWKSAAEVLRRRQDSEPLILMGR